MSDTPYAALIEVGSNILIALHRDISAIYALEAHTPDTLAIAQVSYPQSRGSSFGVFRRRVRLEISPQEYPHWTLQLATRTFKETPMEARTDTRSARSELLHMRADAYSQLMQNIGYARIKLAYEGVLQSLTYQEKEREAHECRSASYDETRVAEWPYVFQYASLEGITLRAAADEILFRAALRHESFARIEAIRMEYTRKIWVLEDYQSLTQLPKEAARQLFGNMLS